MLDFLINIILLKVADSNVAANKWVPGTQFCDNEDHAKPVTDTDSRLDIDKGM